MGYEQVNARNKPKTLNECKIKHSFNSQNELLLWGVGSLEVSQTF
jgi:hypothetical protein